MKIIRPANLLKCPYCKSDELKPYKDFYCCYGCGKTVESEIAKKYNHDNNQTRKFFNASAR